jgi:hypothetical protein
MRIHREPRQTGAKGYALLIILVFLGVTALTLAGMMSWLASSAKQTSQNNQFLASESAAESADELVIATMTRDYLNQAVNSVSAYTSLVPTNTPLWPVAYNFSDASGNLNKTTVAYGTFSSTLQPLTSQFSRLEGYVQPVTITSTATPTGRLYNVPATVSENIQFDTIPIFQFAIFYNLNMEISPGAGMTIQGPVYCNASIWAHNSSLTFNSSVDAVGVISTATTDPFSKNYTSGSGSPNFLVPFLTNQPSLTMPITGTNNSATSVQNILNLPPPGLGAPNPAYLQASNQSYIFNEADLIVSNSAAGINNNSYYAADISVYYLNSNNAPNLTLIPNDLVFMDSKSGTTSKFYSFVTNVTFYDYRESKKVQALQINVASFNKWLTNNVASVYVDGVLDSTTPGGGQGFDNLNKTGTTSKGHHLDSIYVYNNANNGMTASQLPAVRVANGAQLPTADGLTIATPQPLYVLGNYNIQTNSINSSAATTNTAYTYPAALMGDAITILSANWSDTYPLSYGSRNATTTDTVNAACLTGIVQTVPTISGNFSGGVENYLRFLENWNGGNTPLYYNGSIIAMFTSQYATNFWQNPGNYYFEPTRDWSFDSNFKQASKLPPLTPSVKVMLRTPGGWSAN